METRDRLVHELQENLRGDVVAVSPADRARYATDESIFEIHPAVVVAPRDAKDVQTAVAIAQFFSMPITARGGGTGVAGQAIGEGIVLDFAQYFDQLLDVGEKRAVVQPGVVLDRLNEQLRSFGKRFIPDPGSRANCTIGGMVATNASGPHAFHYGATREHVYALQVVLADGALLDSRALARRFPTLHPTLKNEKARIVHSTPKTRKNSSGYALEELCKREPDYTRFLVGTEGTLALTTEVELQILPLPQRTIVGIYPFRSLAQAVRVVTIMRTLRPVAIELIDHHILRALAKANPSFAAYLGLDEAEASLWVEWEEELPKGFDEWPCHLIEEDQARSTLWSLRSKASRLLHDQAGERKPLRCIEDCIVPPEKLERFLDGVRELLLRHDCDGAIFGHAGDAHLHVNPNIDIAMPKVAERVEKLMEDVYTLVLHLGGSISGEHGDGILRRGYANRQWKAVLPLFQLVKEMFDPVGILNPGKKFSARPTPRPSYRDFTRIGLATPPTRRRPVSRPLSNP